MHLQSPAPKKCFRLENYGNIHIYHNIMTKHLDLFFKNLMWFSPQCKMLGLGFDFLSPIVKPRPKTQTPKAQFQPSQIQSKSVPRGLGLTLKSYGPPPTPPHPPTHPQLLSTKEASNKKTQRVNVT